MNSKYLYVILLGLVALSKEFLVFNEEVLVLLAFAIFIYLLVNYGGEMIAGELDARKEKIKEELQKLKDEKDIRCINAINQVFSNIDKLDYLNKRAVFVYLREI